MKMEKDKEGLKANLDVMVIFDRAINVCEDSIYGFITSSDLCEDADTIQSYIGYLVGAERFEKKKGVISEGTTVRDSILTPACKVSNFARNFSLWIKLDFTGRFSVHTKSFAPMGFKAVPFIPTVWIMV